MGHREGIDHREAGQSVSRIQERRGIASERDRIARHVHHHSGSRLRNGPHHLDAGTSARRVQHDAINLLRQLPRADIGLDEGNLREIGQGTSTIANRTSKALDRCHLPR